jgi:chromosome segregation ATPase
VLAQSQAKLVAQRQQLERREREMANMRPPGEELVQARAKQLDAREAELNAFDQELRDRASRIDQGVATDAALAAQLREVEEQKAKLAAQLEVLAKREEEIATMRPPGEELVQARAHQLDQRELELKSLEAQLDSRADQLQREADGREQAAEEFAARLREMDTKVDRARSRAAPPGGGRTPRSRNACAGAPRRPRREAVDGPRGSARSA